MTATYSGTTAGATSANPPINLVAGLGGQIVNAPTATGAKLWFYTSTNASTDLMAANSFSDGYQLGMKTGDPIIMVYSTASNSTVGIIALGVIGYTSTSGACLSTFAITSTAQ